MTIKLGDVAEDRITGFRGVVVAETEWLYGCRRLTLQPRDLKDCQPVAQQSFDDPQCELVEAGWFVRYPETAEVPATETGGPRPEPERGR